MRSIFCIFILVLGLSSASAQSVRVHISPQVNLIPHFRVNSRKSFNQSAQGLRLSFSNYDAFPFELGLHIFRGYDLSVDFSYGISLAYPFIRLHHHRFKIGLSASHFALNHYKRNNDKVGDITEDHLPDSFKPYVEYNWRLTQPFSMFLQAGYRFFHSEMERVTKVLSRYQDGRAKLYRTHTSQLFYGSGFEFSLGLSLNIY